MDQQLSQNDHDLLVTMAATSRMGIADLKTDIADVKTDIAEIKGNFTAQNNELKTMFTAKYTELDTRVKPLEILAINAPEALKKLEMHDEFINDYKSTHKERNLIWAFWFAIASLLISAASALGNFSKLAFK